MKKIQLDIDRIKGLYPRAWKDFEDFYNELNTACTFQPHSAFTEFPFEYQLGIFFRYFIDNGMELDICNIEFEMIPAVIEENFKGHNQAVAHYS